MRIKKGTAVLIKAIVLMDCRDNRPEEKRGYIVQTSRGAVRVNPDEIMISFIASEQDENSK